MARLLLDTNTVIHFLRGHPAVQARWLATSPAEVRISAVTLYELLVGATTSARPELRRAQVETLLRSLAVLPFGPPEAAAAAQIRGQLQPQGRNIGPLDTLIAATALAHDLTVATANVGEFTRVPGLRVDDWTA